MLEQAVGEFGGGREEHQHPAGLQGRGRRRAALEQQLDRGGRRCIRSGAGTTRRSGSGLIPARRPEPSNRRSRGTAGPADPSRCAGRISSREKLVGDAGNLGIDQQIRARHIERQGHAVGLDGDAFLGRMAVVARARGADPSVGICCGFSTSRNRSATGMKVLG